MSKQYLKQNYSISVKVSKIYFSLCKSSNGDLHIAKNIPPFFLVTIGLMTYNERKIEAFLFIGLKP
jgi:hypothetical protein